jgi:hypothetical protein
MVSPIIRVEPTEGTITIHRKNGKKEKVPYSYLEYTSLLKECLRYHKTQILYHTELGEEAERQLRTTI